MPGDDGYRKQVALLVKILPLIAVETVFALKGERPSICSCATCPGFPSISS
jgi:hypothetical protein